MAKPFTWWKYAVIRGKDLPTDLDGRWYEIQPQHEYDEFIHMGPVVFHATHEWEQREDGEVAVVYRRFDG